MERTSREEQYQPPDIYSVTINVSHLEVKGHHRAVSQTSVQNPPAAVEADDPVGQGELLLKLLCLREGTSASRI